MKTCDKQWAETIKSEPRHIPSISPHETYRMGWRAALEWALNEEEDDCNGEGYGCGLAAKIHEEIGDPK